MVSMDPSIELLIGTAEYNNLYNYVTNMVLNQLDPMGEQKIGTPCGSFQWTDYRFGKNPGWQIDFDPKGCKCKGKIKLVQSIERNGWFENNTDPDFDTPSGKRGDPGRRRRRKKPRPGTFPNVDYPGFCESADPGFNRCKRKSPFPGGPDPIFDAPDPGPYTITICAVCVSGGTETVLGCFSFEEDGNGGLNTRPPKGTPPGKCSRGGGPYPGGQPSPDWDEAKENWPKRQEKYLPR